MGNMYLIPVAKKGKEAMDVGLSDADLEQIVMDYNPVTFYKANVSTDHSWSGKSLGQVEKLQWGDENGNNPVWIYATVSNLEEGLRQEILDKRWPNVSIEVLGNYPVEGKKYLTGFSYLGVRMPQITGQPDQSLHVANKEYKQSDMIFLNRVLSDEPKIASQLRENLSQEYFEFYNKEDKMSEEKKDVQTLEKLTQELNDTKNLLQKETDAKKQLEKSIQDRDKTILEQNTAINTLGEDFKKLELRVEQQEREKLLLHKKNIVDQRFAELKLQGKLNPAFANDAEKIENLMALSLEIPEGKKLSPFMAFLSMAELPEGVQLKKEKEVQMNGSANEDDEFARYKMPVDQTELQLHKKILEIQAQNKGMDYETAYNTLMRQGGRG